MEKKLNIKRIALAMETLGLNQASLAKQIAVSRAIVSLWFKGDKFPRPDKLLKLGTTLRLPFQDLVEKSVTSQEPVVAFRKKASRKTKNSHLAKAREMGQLLELLVPFIPYDRMFEPPALKSPSSEYAFIQKAAQSIRQEMGVESHRPIEFDLLVRKINDFEVILIPVFHGDKENHENALHIYLPSSNTTWIYLNLDAYVHDFKFWMAHELGHVLSPSLRDDAAEDFADAFAQALLFPEDLAEKAHASLSRIREKSKQVKKIMDIAAALAISPITVYKAVNNYADENGLPPIDLDRVLFAATTNLCKRCAKMTDHLKLKGAASVTEYIDITKKVFHSPFFDILKKFLANHEKSSGFIQSILDCSLLDAKEIHAGLVG
ncbi:MAG: hypothetical protein VR64_12915 [Desulfatitalea sp. BRH_c12]|nr:MAG: hypothetical protein VR64_12915 [Desulfatitalea sp. BRH_c12]